MRIVSAAILMAFGSSAVAQQTEAQQIATITIVGQAARVASALDQQQASDRIESVIHADGIAQLPDDNVAEAAQRLPGVSVERDQGEGRFVSVRGLGPDLNTVTINGTLVPAPEGGRRAVALDVLPSELVQSLAVTKTLTPDMDANSLGGTVAIESLSAFDHKTPLRTFSVEGGHDDNTGKTSPKLSGAATQKFSLGGGKENFGIAAAWSLHRRDFGSDNVETGGAWDFDDGAALEELEQRRYDIRRDRAGLGLNFDYRPDRFSKYYLRTLNSYFKDTETRHANIIEFDDGAQVPGAVGPAKGERALKSRIQTQKINSFVLGGERKNGPWKASAQAAYSRSQETMPEGIAGATFEGNDLFNGAGYADSRRPDPFIDPGFYDAANFSADSFKTSASNNEDKEKNIRLDLTREFTLAGHQSELKFGGKLSRRDKDTDESVWKFKKFDDGTSAMSNFVRGEVGSGRFGPAIDADAVWRQVGTMNRSDAYVEEDSRIDDYRIGEDVNAAYVMNTLDLDKWRLIGGLRYEGTRFSASGTGLDDDTYVDVERSNKYDNWLPSVHARYALNDQTQLRAAWTNSVVRPTFFQVAPGYLIDGDEATFGNPDLKPLKSSNFDLGVEHYFGRAGVVSAHVFYKKIKNVIYATDVAGSGKWADFAEAHTYANGDKADLYGIELNYSQKFDWLPAPFDGLLVGANLTASRSDAGISGNVDGQRMHRKLDLPNQSDTVGNVMLGWEKDKLSLRLSANYKSDYLMEVAGIDDAAHDQYSQSQTFVDFSARYNVSKAVQLYFQAQNLTDEAYYVYTGRSDFNGQYEKYGPTYKVGMTVAF